jgi:hypothetical protein
VVANKSASGPKRSAFERIERRGDAYSCIDEAGSCRGSRAVVILRGQSLDATFGLRRLFEATEAVVRTWSLREESTKLSVPTDFRPERPLFGRRSASMRGTLQPSVVAVSRETPTWYPSDRRRGPHEDVPSSIHLLCTFHMFHVKRHFPDVWWDGQVTEPCIHEPFPVNAHKNAPGKKPDGIATIIHWLLGRKQLMHSRPAPRVGAGTDPLPATRWSALIRARPRRKDPKPG